MNTIKINQNRVFAVGDNGDSVEIANSHGEGDSFPKGCETTDIQFGDAVVWNSSKGPLLVPSSFSQVRCGQKYEGKLGKIQWKTDIFYDNTNPDVPAERDESWEEHIASLNAIIASGVAFSINCNNSGNLQIKMRPLDGALIGGDFHDRCVPALAGMNDDIIREIKRLNGITEELTQIELACPDTFESRGLVFDRQDDNPVRYQKGVTYKSRCGTFEISLVIFRKNNFKLTRRRRSDGAYMTASDMLALGEEKIGALADLVLHLRGLKVNKQDGGNLIETSVRIKAQAA